MQKITINILKLQSHTHTHSHSHRHIHIPALTVARNRFARPQLPGSIIYRNAFDILDRLLFLQNWNKIGFL